MKEISDPYLPRYSDDDCRERLNELLRVYGHRMGIEMGELVDMLSERLQRIRQLENQLAMTEERRARAVAAAKDVLDAGADLGISVNERQLANAVLTAIAISE